MMNQATGDNQPGTAAAARLLRAGNTVEDRVREAIDARTQAVLDAWLTVAALAYSLAFVLATFGDINGLRLNPVGVTESDSGMTVVFLVIGAFFTVNALAEGLANSLRKPASRPSGTRRFFTAGASALPLLVLLVLAFAAPLTPWPAVLAIAVVAAVPMVVLALRSATRARRAGIRRPAPALSALLDPAGRAITAGLGVALGALTAATGLPVPLLGSIVFIVFALLLVGTRGTRGSAGTVAQFWGRTQWTAFGCSYLLVLGSAVLMARTDGDLAVVSIVGGVLVAAPLVFAAFRPAPIWEA
jgi:hypothetical protein